MTDGERMMLADAIEVAVEAERSRIKWRRATMILSIIVITLCIVVIGG